MGDARYKSLMRRVRICTGCALGFVSRMRIILSPFVSTKEIRFSMPIPDPLPLSHQTLQSQPAAEELFAMPNEQIVPRRRHLRRPRRTLRDYRLYSARKINYGHRGELFAGFVALSSLVTFNLLAGINLILLYSPRRPDPFAPNLGSLNHFFLPHSLFYFRLYSNQDQGTVLLFSSLSRSSIY